MGAGLALWALNFDSLSKGRNVYALDLPGNNSEMIILLQFIVSKDLEEVQGQICQIKVKKCPTLWKLRQEQREKSI